MFQQYIGSRGLSLNLHVVGSNLANSRHHVTCVTNVESNKTFYYIHIHKHIHTYAHTHIHTQTRAHILCITVNTDTYI